MRRKPPNKGLPEGKVSCVNCGKAHKAWQRRCCSTFQAFLDDTKSKRINLVMRTVAARTLHNAPPAPQTQPTYNGPAKRPRTQNTPELTQEEKRGRGRPTNIELAVRDCSQSRLRLDKTCSGNILLSKD